MKRYLRRFTQISIFAVLLIPFQNCGGLRSFEVNSHELSLTASGEAQTNNGNSPSGETTFNGGSSSTPINTGSQTSNSTPTTGNNNSGSNSSSGSTTTSAPPGCSTPLKKYRFSLGQDIYLQKNLSQIYQVQIPMVGRAFALWSGTLYNDSSDTHGWQGYVHVGNPVLDGAQLGDDIYGNSQRSAAPIGFGNLTSQNQTVTLYLGDVYVDNPSYDYKGLAVRALAQSFLDVWVEDVSCKDKYISYSQIYNFSWPTTMVQSALMNIELPSPRGNGQLTLVAVAEGSTPPSGVPANPNTVRGHETATLATHIAVNGAIYNQKIVPIPASGGQGHLAMQNQISIPYSSLPNRFTVSLDVGSNAGSVPIYGPTILFALFENQP